MAAVVQSKRLVGVQHDDGGVVGGVLAAIPLLHDDASAPAFHLDKESGPDIALQPARRRVVEVAAVLLALAVAVEDCKECQVLAGEGGW